jgi:hypothetical protein
MRWTSQAAAGLVAIVLAGCSGRDRSHDAGAPAGGGTGTETGSMSDTSGMSADTGLKGTATDTAAGAKATQPDQAQPAPSTSDSLSSGVDSAR